MRERVEKVGIFSWNKSVVNHINAVQREKYRSASSSTQGYQKLEGKLKRDFILPQVPYRCHPEVLRVIVLHWLEPNISKNKNNQGQIISLGI